MAVLLGMGVAGLLHLVLAWLFGADYLERPTVYVLEQGWRTPHKE